MDFVKKNWQFRDIISEDELNRMEDGIEEGITKAEQAQQTADDAATAAANAQQTADDAQSDIDDYKNEIRSLGLGIDVDPRTTENLDLEVQPGWVTTTPETIGIPPFRGYGVVRIDRRNGERVAQTYYHLSGAMEVAVYTRVLGGTGWTDWDRVIYASSFERGANENGEYIIFPSGFAVCFRRLQIDFSNTDVQSVDMPIAFANRSLLYTGWNLSHSHSAPNIRDRGLIFDYAAGTVAAWRFVVSGYSTHADTASVTLYAAGFIN